MTFAYNGDPPSEANVRFQFDFSLLRGSSRIIPRAYVRAGRSRLPVLFIHWIFVAISFEEKERGGREGDEKSERWGVGGERSRNDRRSVLKSLLNLSLPNETAHIYRQYRSGEGLAAGRLRNRVVDTNLRLKRSDRADRGKFVLRHFPRDFADDKDKWPELATRTQMYLESIPRNRKLDES